MNNDLDALLQEAPTLTFEPFPQKKEEVTPAPTTKPEPKEEKIEVVLTPEEQKMVNDFASQIDLSNTQLILQYGAGSQKKLRISQKQP